MIENDITLESTLDETDFTVSGLVSPSLQEIPEKPQIRRIPARRKVTHAEVKAVAQEMLMDGIANVLGYFQEDDVNIRKLKKLGLTPEEFGPTLEKLADRVARQLGYEQSWKN